TDFVSVDNQVQTVAVGGKPALRVESAGTRGFVVRGQLPVGHPGAVKIYEVEDPASFARGLFIEALRRKGVRVAATPLGRNDSSKLLSSDELSKLPRVGEYTSPPFSEYAKVILKVSQNLHASALPILIGTRKGRTSLSGGLRREGEVLAGLGVDIGTISF